MREATIANKVKQVEELTNKIQNSTSTIIVDYLGLTVAEITELRNKLRDEGCEMKVTKNNFIKRAMKNAGYQDLEEYCEGPNAVAFSGEDSVAAARILHEFAKTHKELNLKAGVIDGNISPKEELEVLATLPNKEGMLSMLLSVLQAPIRNIALVVKAVGEERENA